MEVGLCYTADQLVFIDECYVDKRHTARTRGWGEKGQPLHFHVPFLRGKRSVSIWHISNCSIDRIPAGLRFFPLYPLMDVSMYEFSITQIMGLFSSNSSGILWRSCSRFRGPIPSWY